MRQNISSQSGFSLIEAIVAITLITVGALALATTFVGAAATNKRVAGRQQAISLARQQIDRVRSLEYEDISMFSTNQTDTDWLTKYCPLINDDGSVACGASILNGTALSRVASCPVSLSAACSEEPRQAKIAPQRDGAAMACNPDCPTVRRNGVILYTYIYWNNWLDSTLGKQYKLISVVARFADPRDGLSSTEAKRYTSVTLTSIVADIPELGQVR